MRNRTDPLRLVVFRVIAFLILPALSSRADETAVDTCRPVITADARSEVIFIRPHENAFLDCTLPKQQMQELIREFPAQADNQHGNFKSIFIGRLVNHPWLSNYLAVHALAHAGWDGETGQPETVSINRFVRDVLSAPDLLEQIQAPFAGSGYTVIGVSVEKVLVDKAAGIDWLEIHEPALVPYDALVHYLLEINERY